MIFDKKPEWQTLPGLSETRKPQFRNAHFLGTAKDGEMPLERYFRLYIHHRLHGGHEKGNVHRIFGRKI
ncbi:hypothetical protein D3C80_1581630 [compost metagenome]